MRVLAEGISFAVVALAACASAGGQAPPATVVQDPVIAAAETWIGRALIVRGFPAANELRYDALGHMEGTEKPTDWTLAGFELNKVSRRGAAELQLDGVRVAIRWNPDQHTFDRHPLKTETMRVMVSTTDAREMETALGAIFSVGVDPALQRSMPAYWSHYFIPSLAWPADGLDGVKILGGAARPPDGFVYPQIEKKNEPGFTPQGLADHLKGTVQLKIVVDSTGVPERIAVRQPLGYGLDERTVESVSRYRFHPGVLNGLPVAVEMTLNQAFE